MLDRFAKFETFLHDFLAQLAIIIMVYLTDAYVYFELRKNFPQLSLLLFTIGYFGARAIIRAIKKEKLFGSFVRHGPIYCLTIAFSNWLIYLLMIRSARFS